MTNETDRPVNDNRPLDDRPLDDNRSLDDDRSLDDNGRLDDDRPLDDSRSLDDDRVVDADQARDNDRNMDDTHRTDGDGTLDAYRGWQDEPTLTDDTTDTSPTNDAADATPATGASTEDPLVPTEASVDFKARWAVIQQGFVDDPRAAVTDADKLVSDVLQRLSATFDEQHKDLESQWADGEPSTEDLRSALQRYRAFFERLLTL